MLEDRPHLAILKLVEQQIHQCKDCSKYLKRGECPRAEYKDSKLNRTACLPSDIACEEFEPKKKHGRMGAQGAKGAKKDWKLDLTAEIPETLEPCSFTGTILTESCWLPYRDKDGNIEVRPSIILVEKGKEPQILDFMKQDTVKGTFPARQLDSLMTPKAAKMILENTPIDPHDIDKEIDQAIKKHLDVEEPESILIKRWCEGSFFYDCFDSFPLQNILGVSESGKSRLCLLNLSLCYHAEPVINVTEAGIFRSKEEDKVSLILDEAEYLNDKHMYATLRTLLNASYSKNSGFVTRYDENSEGKRIKHRFNLYSPMCISGIGGLEGVTASRAFTVVMKRTDRDFPKADARTYRNLRDKLYALRAKKAFEIHELYQKIDISDIVTARFEELFKPLFTLTKIFGTEKEYEILSKWVKNYAQNFRTEALNIAEEEMILVSLGKMKSVNMDWYALKDLADQVMREYGKPISSPQVSKILRRLGINQRKKSDTIHFYAPEELIIECAKRIGINFCSLRSHNSQPPTETQPAKTAANWIQDAFGANTKP